MNVDKAGGDGQPRRIHALLGLGLGQVTDGGHTIGDDADIGAATWAACTIDDVAAGNDHIERIGYLSGIGHGRGHLPWSSVLAVVFAILHPLSLDVTAPLSAPETLPKTG